MSAPTEPRRRFLVRTATETAPGAAPAPVAAPSPPADGEPLVDRVWRQVRDGLDRERLLPADDKRRRDLAKRLDKPPESNGWATYVAGLAHTIDTGKARNRRNAGVFLLGGAGCASSATWCSPPACWPWAGSWSGSAPAGQPGAPAKMHRTRILSHTCAPHHSKEYPWPTSMRVPEK